MNVKTLTAPTIHAALIEARRMLGDDVVLLESVPPENGRPARITVMTDRPVRASERALARPNETRTGRPAAAGGDGSASRRMLETAGVLAEESARNGERLSRTHPGRPPVDDTAHDSEHGGDEPYREWQRGRVGEGTGRGRLFPLRASRSESGVPRSHEGVPVHDPAVEAIERLIHAQLALLHERLDQMERRFGGAIIGSAQKWTVHPLFSGLLHNGFRPATVTRLFDSLAAKGYESDTPVETLKWALAQEVRRSMDLSAPMQANGAQVFIGPTGSGKTSLLLKLSRHPGFYGRRDTAVVVVEPEEPESRFHHSPIELFRMHGLPVQAVRTTEEMREAVMRVQRFDHILIDTPPIPAQKAAAAKALRHVKRMVDPIVPLRVQLVFNTTRSLRDFDRDFLHGLVLRPHTLALTHLDETVLWGRVAEWLMALNMPVQFVSTSPAVPDGVASFSPAWFVEEMMKL